MFLFCLTNRPFPFHFFFCPFNVCLISVPILFRFQSVNFLWESHSVCVNSRFGEGKFHVVNCMYFATVHVVVGEFG